MSHIQISLSVIIPHKNSFKLLQRCLDSIPDSEDIQVIVVDDNSDDVNKSNLLNSTRSNVEIIFLNKSLTAGGARNVGLKKVSKKHVIFADADDFFLPDAFTIFKNTLNSDNDICYYKVSSVYSDTFKPATRHIGVNRLVERFKEDENELRLKHIVPWGKVFLSSYIKKNEFNFDAVPASNDVMFGVYTGFYASKINVVDETVYCITMNGGSISNTISKRNNKSRYKVALKYNKFLRQKNMKQYQNSIRPLFFNSLRFGLKEVFYYWYLLFKFNDSLFYDLNLKRSISSYFKLKVNNQKNDKYLIK